MLGKLSGSYTSFFRSMNLPGVLDSMLGEVVVGHVSQNDGDSVRRFVVVLWLCCGCVVVVLWLVVVRC